MGPGRNAKVSIVGTCESSADRQGGIQQEQLVQLAALAPVNIQAGKHVHI